jgi:uncharacterized membrane protein
VTDFGLERLGFAFFTAVMVATIVANGDRVSGIIGAISDGASAVASVLVSGRAYMGNRGRLAA